MAVRSRLKLLLMEKNLARAKAGEPPLTIRKLAEETGLALSTITGLTANRARRVDYDTLNALCNYLECTPGELFEYVADQQLPLNKD